MAELAIEIKNLLLERIIMTIKRYGEPASDGYKIDFSIFAKQFPKDEIVSESQAIKEIPVTESNIFGFFKGQEKMQIQLISEGRKHCLYLKPKGTLSSKRIKEEAKTIINEMLKEQKRLSYKKVYEELSRRIVFFEYHLIKKNEPVKEYIQQLLPSSDMKVGKQEMTSSNETVAEDFDKMDDETIINAIASIIEAQGETHDGSRRIAMDKLCVTLAENHPIMLAIQKKGKGTTRDCLVDSFGKSLLIKTFDGIEWVSPLSQSVTGDQMSSAAKQTSDESEMSVEKAEEQVRKEILSILEQQGIALSGYRQIILGTLCNALADSSTAYQIARSAFKGNARNFLLKRFGNLLTIEFLDGKDWVKVPLTTFDDKAEEHKAGSSKKKPASSDIPVPENIPSPVEESPVPVAKSPTPVKEIKATKTAKAANKKKETATELLIRELTNLTDEELNSLLLVIQLVSSDVTVNTEKKKAEHASNRDETTNIGAIAESVRINAQDVLEKNKTINKITEHLTIGNILEIVTEEMKMRKGLSDEQMDSEADNKSENKSKVIPQYEKAAMTEADYEGLDDWLPF